MRHTWVMGLAELKPTTVYDTYWYFAHERQQIMLRKLSGSSRPWTSDQILDTYRFTNAYRATDRVSQYLIRRVIYAGPQEQEEVFFRTLLFKLFNKIETWEWLRRHLGEISWRDYCFSTYDLLLSELKRGGKALYNSAYIMPSGKSAFGSTRKHQNNLKLLEAMMKEETPKRIFDCGSLEKSYELLIRFPTLGPFLAYQFAIDLGYSVHANYDESEFVVAGPGAKDGIRKCFRNADRYTDSDIIRLVAERQAVEFERLGLSFNDLWGRPLQLIDCQNLFCETDKYARVRHPEFMGHSGRVRIKRKYQENSKPLSLWFPPKWNLEVGLSYSNDFEGAVPSINEQLSFAFT